MYTPDEKRREYWNYFIAEAFVEGNLLSGVTGPRLRKVMPKIMQDDNFWQDVVIRHSGLEWTPTQLAINAPLIHGHCMGNFWRMVVQGLMEAGLIK